MFSSSEILDFQQRLLTWFATYRRDLPWRRTKDPYAIWISEIMLQQTRVAAVIPYYERFLARFPDFNALADAPESDLLAHWAGLGYYYRARNLQKAARQMKEAGRFPDTYEEIRQLPGIGDYTAAAVASIGFNLPYAVLDGNVYRVLSRVFNDSTNIAAPSARKHFGALAEKLLNEQEPGAWNEAMMELGATICLPKNPQCLLCPVSALCRARGENLQNELPVKIKPQRSVFAKRTLFWVERDGSLLLWQRPADSRLMPGFWELPERTQFPSAVEKGRLGSFRHGITVHNYTFDVVEAEPPEDPGICQWVRFADLPRLPVSTVLKKAQRLVEKLRPPLASSAQAR